MKTTLLFCFLFLSACSMYKSNGRKQLESDAPGQIQSFSLKDCQKVNSVQAWLQSEFPTKSYEIIVSESDLEVLKSVSPKGQITITATQINAGQKVSCIYEFANEKVWASHQAQFVDELENNMMTSE